MLTSLLLFLFCWQCSENQELLEKVKQLEHQLEAVSSGSTLVSSEQLLSGENIDELKKKIQFQVIQLCF